MIFVTVGTHEQPFDRLLKKVDELKAQGAFEDEVIIQSGFSDYEPKYCKWSKLLPYPEMVKNVAEARIVITHGGPSSFIMPLQIGKIPIVVPRRTDFNEHVNNHQVDFSHALEERQGNIIVVDDVENLGTALERYDEIVADMNHEVENNNACFNAQIEEIAQELIKSIKRRRRAKIYDKQCEAEKISESHRLQAPESGEQNRTQG